jgi:hypothetical protein
LQVLGFGTWGGIEATATAVATAIVTAATAVITATAESHSTHRGTPCIHYLLDQALDGDPFVIVGHLQAFLKAIHQLLLKLGRVKVSAPSAATIVLGHYVSRPGYKGS